MLENMITMQLEWEAWQAVVAEFKSLDMDINRSEFNPLVKAICLWGERLHALRATHTPEVVTQALTRYQEEYEATR